MTIDAVLGDLTRERADALVNAANSSLLGGGGVDGALHAAAGPELLAECRRLRADTCPHGLPVGQAVATGAGRLPARWVIHTVGPNRAAGQTDEALLADCYRNSLDIACGLGVPGCTAGMLPQRHGWRSGRSSHTRAPESTGCASCFSTSACSLRSPQRWPALLVPVGRVARVLECALPPTAPGRLPSQPPT